MLKRNYTWCFVMPMRAVGTVTRPLAGLDGLNGFRSLMLSGWFMSALFRGRCLSGRTKFATAFSSYASFEYEGNFSKVAEWLPNLDGELGQKGFLSTRVVSTCSFRDSVDSGSASLSKHDASLAYTWDTWLALLPSKHSSGCDVDLKAIRSPRSVLSFLRD